MKQRLKEQIAASKILTEKEQEFYLKLVEILPDEKLLQLSKIFEKESEAPAQSQAFVAQQKAQINAQFMEDATKLFKEEEKQAIKKEETQEKKEADKLLKKINEL